MKHDNEARSQGNCKVKKRPIQNLSVALGRNRPKVSFGVISGECVSWQAFLKNDFFTKYIPRAHL